MCVQCGVKQVLGGIFVRRGTTCSKSHVQAKNRDLQLETAAVNLSSATMAESIARFVIVYHRTPLFMTKRYADTMMSRANKQRGQRNSWPHVP